MHGGRIPSARLRLPGATVSTVGTFAGCGGVILAMGLALTVGLWVDWQLRGLWVRVAGRVTKGRPT